MMRGYHCNACGYTWGWGEPGEPRRCLICGNAARRKGGPSSKPWRRPRWRTPRPKRSVAKPLGPYRLEPEAIRQMSDLVDRLEAVDRLNVGMGTETDDDG